MSTPIDPDSTARVPAPVAMKHYSLPMGKISSGGNVIKRQLPVYPESLLASCRAPFEVQVGVEVNRDGRVKDVFGVVLDASPPPWNAYFLATQAVVMQWRFNPLRVTRWAADTEGNSHVVDSANVPFQRFYTFRFACHAGKPDVSLIKGGAA